MAIPPAPSLRFPISAALASSTRRACRFSLRAGHAAYLVDATEAISVMQVRGRTRSRSNRGLWCGAGPERGHRSRQSLRQPGGNPADGSGVSLALGRVDSALAHLEGAEQRAAAWAEAAAICDEDVALNRAIGQHGAGLIRVLAQNRAGERPDSL